MSEPKTPAEVRALKATLIEDAVRAAIAEINRDMLLHMKKESFLVRESLQDEVIKRFQKKGWDARKDPKSDAYVIIKEPVSGPGFTEGPYR